MLYHADRPNNGFAKIVKLPMDGKNTVVYVTVKLVAPTHFLLVVSSENAQLTMEEPELGFQIG
jgi:hypothetical protein